MFKVRFNAPVTLGYTFIAFAVLIVDIVTASLTTRLLFAVYYSSLFDPLFYPRLIGHIFGHVGFEHYMVNFLMILLLGPLLEEKYGAAKMVMMIVVTALVTGIVHVIFFSSALLGASGVLFMMIVLSSFVNFDQKSIPLTLILVIIFYLGRELFHALVLDDQISQFTHILGGICGLFFGFTQRRLGLASARR